MAAAERRVPAPGRMTAEEFCTEYYDRVVGLAVRVFGRAEGGDVAHAALERMLASYDSLDPDRDPWPWVSAVVRNAGRQSLRRRFAVPLDETDSGTAATTDAAFDAVAAREDRRTLARALDRVPRADRDVLLMRVRDELPFAEIARRTGRTPGALRVQATRARQRLADEFARLGGTAYGIGAAVSARMARLRERAAGLAAAVPASAQLVAVVVVCGVAGGPAGQPPIPAAAAPAIEIAADDVVPAAGNAARTGPAARRVSAATTRTGARTVAGVVAPPREEHVSASATTEARRPGRDGGTRSHDVEAAVAGHTIRLHGDGQGNRPSACAPPVHLC